MMMRQLKNVYMKFGCCQTLTGVAKDCEANMGGIKRIWVACSDQVTTKEKDEDAHTITSITPCSAWVEIEVNRQTSSFETTWNFDETTGVRYWSAALTIQSARLSPEKMIAFEGLSLSDVDIIIQDNNNNYWYINPDSYANMTEGTAGTGTSFDDLNGFNVTLTANEGHLPYQVTETAMNTIINCGEPK